MVYQIYYTPKDSKEGKRYVIFDIEYHLAKDNMNEINNWITEINCLTCVNGVTKFLHDKLNDKNFNYDEFATLGKEIEDIRGLLYERYDNKPKKYSRARDFHYNVFGKVLEEKIEAFAKKYDLHINIEGYVRESCYEMS